MHLVVPVANTELGNEINVLIDSTIKKFTPLNQDESQTTLQVTLK